MQIYHDYADVYHAIGQGAFAEAQARLLLGTLGAQPRRVLDLACGAGAASLVFAAAGCSVVGVDRAPRMLSLARARARDQQLAVAFVEADLRSFAQHAPFTTPPIAFDLITCLYDSLNYLLDDADLAHVFRAVAQFLAPEGRFVFDLNMPAEYATWDESFEVMHDNGNYLVYNQLSYDQRTSRGHGRIVWFTREIERWWRGEELHVERAWTEGEVHAALGAAGLRLVHAITPEGAPANTQSRRVVYHVTHSPRP